MSQALHSLVRTTHLIRKDIRDATSSQTELARRHNVTRQAIRKWQGRDSAQKRSHRADTLRTTLTPGQESIIGELHTMLLLSPNDLLAFMRESLIPAVSRTGLGRWPRRHGVSQLTDLVAQESAEPPKKETLKDYEPGYWHAAVKTPPNALVGAAGAAFALGDGRMLNIGLIALQSLALTSGVAYASKHHIARARSDDGKSAWDVFGNAEKRSDGFLPYGHASVAFIAVTPFAKAYDAPCLHGVAASVRQLARATANTGCPIRLPAVFSAMRLVDGCGNLSAKSGSRLMINPGPKELSVSFQKEY